MDDIVQCLKQIPDKIRRIKEELSKRIYGQDELIELLLAGIFGRGHCLLNGVPGLAKTMLVSSVAELAELDFKRIQFTPDMMPGDITGSEILELDKLSGERVFKFMRGPVFTQMLLADEINRTTPKTQAALLEAMQEQAVTVAGKREPLPEPFFVLATQNPIEQEGTYPLPEAQLDRFFFMLNVSYPTFEEEMRILRETTEHAPQPLNKVITAREITECQEAIRAIPIPESVAAFATKLVRSTRPGEPGNTLADQYFRWGAGPRACQCLAVAGKVLAAFDGRFNVAKEDILKAAESVLRHRVVMSYRAEAEHCTQSEILQNLIRSIR